MLASYRPRKCKWSGTPQMPLLSAHQGTSPSSLSSQRGSLEWSQLPTDVLLFIFSLLSTAEERRSVMFVCRLWNSAMNDYTLWNNSCVRLKHLQVPMTYWSLVKLRRIRNICLQNPTMASTVSALGKLYDCSEALVSLHLAIKETVDYQIFSKTILPHVAKFESLQILSIVGVREEGVFAHAYRLSLNSGMLLAALPSLKELCLVVVSVTGNCEHKYPLQHQGLESLTLDRCAMDDENDGENEICVMTSQLPKLKHLEILYPYQPVTSIHRYHGFEVATCNEYTQVEIDEGEVPTHLLKLKINKCNMYGSLWKPPVPARIKYIQHLDISFCAEVPYQILSHLPHLKELNLSGNDCNDDVLRLLRCPLESIELQRCRHITWVGLRYLSKLNGSWMQHLGLGHCQQLADGGTVSKIHSMFPSLTYLDLSHWPTLDDGTLGQLLHLPLLHKLVAHNTQLSSQAVKDFRCHYRNKCVVVTS